MFHSIQGEGAHAGCTSVFVRLQGCPVGCEFCDAKLTWYAGGEKLSVAEIVGRIDQMPKSELIIITGGEPLIHNLDGLIFEFSQAFPERFIHLETSGKFGFKGYLRPNWITLSPKRAANWDVEPEVLKRAHELKFVVDEEFDPRIARDILHTANKLRGFGRPTPKVYLMPEGAPPSDESVERTLKMLEHYPLWRFSPRLQYDYAPITKREGDTNQKITRKEAIDAARTWSKEHRTNE